MFDNRGNGSRIPSQDDVNSPKTYRPGTLIAEVLATHEKRENCPVINPEDSGPLAALRSAQATRTISN